MKHTPYGYEIREGKVAIHPEQAERLRQMCENYLSGMTLVKAAEEAGIDRSHSGVKNMMRNRRYLGDELYPQILDEEIFVKVSVEMQRRAQVLGRDNLKGKMIPTSTIRNAFSSPRIPRVYEDPISQAEYAYSLITGKEES